MGALGSGEAYGDFYRQVEALGLDAVWTEDRIFHAANMLDPLMLLAGAAASTRRIQLGTAVLVLTLRNVAVLARQVSTLHHLSGGRLALGVSLGGEETLGDEEDLDLEDEDEDVSAMADDDELPEDRYAYAMNNDEEEQ